jgi:hypothetical protein
MSFSGLQLTDGSSCLFATSIRPGAICSWLTVMLTAVAAATAAAASAVAASSKASSIDANVISAASDMGANDPVALVPPSGDILAGYNALEISSGDESAPVPHGAASQGSNGLSIDSDDAEDKTSRFQVSSHGNSKRQTRDGEGIVESAVSLNATDNESRPLAGIIWPAGNSAAPLPVSAETNDNGAVTSLSASQTASAAANSMPVSMQTAVANSAAQHDASTGIVELLMNKVSAAFEDDDDDVNRSILGARPSSQRSPLSSALLTDGASESRDNAEIVTVHRNVRQRATRQRTPATSGGKSTDRGHRRRVRPDTITKCPPSKSVNCRSLPRIAAAVVANAGGGIGDDGESDDDGGGDGLGAAVGKEADASTSEERSAGKGGRRRQRRQRPADEPVDERVPLVDYVTADNDTDEIHQASSETEVAMHVDDYDAASAENDDNDDDDDDRRPKESAAAVWPTSSIDPRSAAMVQSANAPAATSAAVGLSYRSRGSGAPAAVAAALVDPIHNRRPAGAVGSVRNWPGIWFSPPQLMSVLTTATATVTERSVQTRLENLLTESNEIPLFNRSNNASVVAETNATVTAMTTAASATSRDGENVIDKTVTLSYTDNNITTVDISDDGDPLATTNSANALPMLRCHGGNEYQWNFIATDQRHSYDGYKQQQQMTLVAYSYAVGLAFSVISLWSIVNVLLLLVAMSFVISLRRRCVFVDNPQTDHAVVDVVQGKNYCVRNCSCRASLLVRLSINCAVAVLSTSRSLCFLIGDSAWMLYALNNGDRISVTDVLFEMSWPCLVTSLVAYMIGVGTSSPTLHVSSTSQVSPDKTVMRLDPFVADVRRPRGSPTTCRTVVCLFTALVALPSYFVIAFVVGIVIELCQIDAVWIVAHRATFVSLSLALSTVCFCTRRKQKCWTARRHDKEKKPDGHLAESRNCLTVAFGLLMVSSSLWVAIESAACLFSPVVASHFRIPETCIWWTRFILQSMIRVHELVLCTIFCVMSLPPSIFGDAKNKRTVAGRHSICHLDAIRMTSSGQLTTSFNANSFRTLGTGHFLQFPMTKKIMSKSASIQTQNVPFGSSASAMQPHTTATCRRGIALNGKVPPAATASPVRRPRSMLYNDNGFIRFRLDCDPEVDSDARTIDNDDGDMDIPYDTGNRYAVPSSDVAAASGANQCSFQAVCRQHSADRRPSMLPGQGQSQDRARQQSSLSLTSSSLFSFRAPSVDLQESFERELDRCDIWRAACDDDGAVDGCGGRLHVKQIGVDERILRMMQLYADVSVFNGKSCKL